MEYLEFLQNKTPVIQDAGFNAVNLNKHLFDFQKDIVIKAVFTLT